MQNKKITAFVLAVAIVVAAIVGYEFSIVNSLSGYTKVSVTFAQTCSIKFANTAQYNITFLPLLPGPDFPSTVAQQVAQYTTIQVSADNSTKYFGATQGARYSFSGLQMVVGNASSKQVNSNREIYLTLYVKSTVSNSKPIISLKPYFGTQ